MGSLDSVGKSIEFLKRNSQVKARDVNKLELRASVAEIEKNAANGLSREYLEELAHHVVFKDGYDLATRRKILYSMVPEGEEFPYRIIPLAVSSAAVVPVNPSWQYAVLSWLGSLLEYCVIDAHNRYVHICYCAIFNLASRLNLVLLVCKILGYMTNRADVTEWRTKILLKLKEKPGFYEKVSQLLRLYQLFRPDLVAGKLYPRHLVQKAPRQLKNALLLLRSRLQDGSEREDFKSGQGIWPDMQKAEKANPFARSTAIPQPDNNYYAETMEEKTSKVIFLSQYRRFADLVRGMPDYKRWRWPNNPACHLSSPVIIPLFRPHEETALVSLANWLEIALRTELVEGFGNPSKERCEKLLRAVHRLVTVSGTQIPVANSFLVEYMTIWDQNSHFDIVLSLLECVTFSSEEFVSSILFSWVSDLLDHASVGKWCRIVDAVSNIAGAWAIRAHQEISRKEDRYFQWPEGLDEPVDNTIIGFWYLCDRMERFFLAAIIEYSCHPMVVNQILDYYIKINMHAEVLNLPVVFLPPAAITVAIITHSNLVTVHRLGKMLASMPEAMDRIRKMETHGFSRSIQSDCLSMCESFNQSVSLYLGGVFIGNVFGSNYQQALNPFYPFESLPKILSTKAARSCASVIHALPYLPLFAKRTAAIDINELTSDEKKKMKMEVVAELTESGLTGIGMCITAYTGKKNL